MSAKTPKLRKDSEKNSKVSLQYRSPVGALSSFVKLSGQQIKRGQKPNVVNIEIKLSLDLQSMIGKFDYNQFTGS